LKITFRSELDSILNSLDEYAITTDLQTEKSYVRTELNKYVLTTALTTKLADYRLLTNNTFGAVVVDTLNTYRIKPDGTNKPYGRIAITDNSGYMDVGKALVFYTANNTDNFGAELKCTATNELTTTANLIAHNLKSNNEL
jgi:hypothetical protein